MLQSDKPVPKRRVLLRTWLRSAALRAGAWSKRSSDARALGIGSRLAVSFAAVAALAVLANLIAEYGTSIVSTTTSYDAAGMVPVELNPASRTPQQLSRVASAEPGDIRAGLNLTDVIEAITRYRRATETSLETPDEKHVAEFNRAGKYLDDVLQESLRQVRPEQAQLIARSRTLRRTGQRLVLSNNTQRTQLAEYLKQLESVDRLLRGALDRNWKIFGRVLARQSLLSLRDELTEIRTRAVRTMPGSDFERAPSSGVAQSEKAFATTLSQHQAEFARSQGDDWLRHIQAAFSDAVAIRTSLLDNALQMSQTHLSFDTETAALLALAHAMADAAARALHDQPTLVGQPEPATKSPSDRGGRPRASGLAPLDQITTERATMVPAMAIRLSVAAVSAAMVLLLLAVAIQTVRSIVGPIKQFIVTTRRLSSGESAARFERGGIAELDSLAGSLNRMAETLQAAQANTRDYRDALEERIDERTRQLQHLAEHDPLTGLPNRRQLLSHLTKALTAAKEEKASVAVFFLDLDNFKNINDSMGHTFGDRVLQSIGHLLRDAVAPGGFAARFGGDEFMVVYSRCENAAHATRQGERLIAAFQKPLLIERRELLVGVSVGGSIYPEHEVSSDALLRAADAALFRAKSLGRNQFSLFSRELLERASKKFDIEQGLRRAVERNAFELVFQPEVDFQEHGTQIAEALLRWRLPDRRHISPAQFLAVAQESGLNARISDWVLRTAFEWVSQWRSGPWPAARVAINVSASQLMGTRFPDQIRELLAHHNIPPHCIEIELTEDILQTGPSTIRTLREIRDLNLSIALDDFGTGFSSLTSLQQLPLTRVKLDQSLVACIDTDPRSAAIAGAIIRLCGELGLEVTAEGIERLRQLELLLEYGPICFQGYLISYPVEANALPATLVALPEKLRGLSLQLSALTRSRRAGDTAFLTDPLLLDLQASKSF